MICPNKNLKEWKELEAAVPDMAYFIWDLNDGNGIDCAPNGAPSILFNTLLELTGDRELAIKLKANVYRTTFRNWFGDWIKSPESCSKIVDENGEPRIMFHGGAKSIEAFKLISGMGSNTGTGYYTEPETNRQIPIDSNRAMFFTTKEGVAQSYRILSGVKTASHLKNLVREMIITYNSNNKVSFINKYNESAYGNTYPIKEQLDFFYEDLDQLSYFNPRFTKFKRYLMQLQSKGQHLSDKEKKAFIEMLKEVRTELDKFDLSDMNLSDWVSILPQSHKILERYNNPEGIKRLLNGEIPLEMLYEWELYKKIQQQRKKQGLPEIANYEEVHITLSHNDRFYFWYDGNRLKIWDNNWKDYFVTDINEKLLSDFINRALFSNEKAQKELADNPKLKFFFNYTELYPVYLNIRNPSVHDYEGTHQGQGYKQSKKYPFGYIAARQVDKAINNGNDGVIYLNLYDPYLADNVGVFAPNQIKSIYNVGTFYTEDNRIRYSLPFASNAEPIVNVDSIEQTSDKIDNLLNFLRARFPKLTVVFITADKIPSGVRKDANAFVKDGVIYLVRGRITSESTIEEFLHPLLEALYEDNPAQFNILVEEAKLAYPELWKQIQETYSDENGFTENDREHELLAHALSEAVNNRFENKQHQSVFKQLLNGFLAWLNNLLYKYTGKNIILKKTKLGELVDDIFNPNKELKVKIDSGSIKYNISSASQATIEKARKGIQQRIKSLKHYSNPNIRQIQQMEKLYDDLNKLDSIQGAQELIEYMSHSLQDAYQFLQKPVDDINSKLLVQMKRDYLSFFLPVLQDIQYIIDTTDEFKILPDYDKFSRVVREQLVLANAIVNKFDNLVKAKSKKALLEYGEAAGSPTIQQTVDELDNPIYDLNWFETFVGLNSSAGNEVLRVMTDMLQNEINKTKRETFEDGIRLVNLYNAAVKANPDVDVQRLLQEVDEFNQPTGYFTRSRNWGKFYRDQLKFLDDLAKRLGVSVDRDGNYEFTDNNQKREFVKQRTYWQLKHGVLKYTKQYYDAKFKMSLEAQEALDEVNNAIQLIKNRATVGKHFLANLLSAEETDQLKDLLKQRAVLSSEYKYDGTKKEGEELRIAKEISEFRQAVGENLSWDIDADRFNRDADYMIKKYGANSPEYKAWYEASTEEQYTPDFYERLERLFGSASPKSRALYLKRQRLLAPYKNSNDKETMDNVPDSVRQQIKAIDEELSELRPRITKEEYEEFKNFAEIAKTAKYYEDADAARAEGRYEEWYEANHYEDKSGNVRPISVYTYLKPKNGRYVYRLPNYFYKKVNTDSMWINPEFDNNGPYVQPNKQEYDNSEAWNKIQKNPTVKALYDALIQAMNDSNHRISFFDTIREGRLPQITGRMMAVLARADNKFEALKYLVKDSFMVKDDDTDYVADYERRNDGSLIKLVPTRFIKLLDNPAMITSDVVGSVIQYIEMSRNYQNMSSIQNDLELLMYRLELITIQTKLGQKQGKNTNLYKKAESLLDMVLYGKRQSQLIINGVNVTKLLDKVYNYISLSNLAYNVWAIGANYVTGQGTLDIEGIAGKYFNTSDLSFAKREFLRHFGTLTANIGNVNHKDKVSMLMLLLQVSRSNKETFDRLDQSRVLRGINQHFWYNGYSAGDFVIKGLLMLAVLHGYKLINGEYMTEEQYVATLSDKNAARKHFRALQGTLYDALDIVNGEVRIVALNASELAVRKALNKAQKKIGVLAARIDGNITDTDRAAVHQNMLTRFLVMHRNFMIVGLQERLKSKQFNYATGLMEGGVYADFFGNMCWKVIREIFSQGKINFIANALATYKLMDSVELYNIRRTLLDMFNIALWSLAISPLFVALAEGDGDDNWGLQALAYMTMRISFEFRSLYNPLELTNLLNSPSAAVSTLGLFFNMFKLIFPGTYLRENNIFGEVKSGAYKGWPKVLRNIVKMTPAKNVYEFFSTQGIENKRTYLENLLMF